VAFYIGVLLITREQEPPEDEQPGHDGAVGPASTWELEGEEEGGLGDAH
jgi:hypothetical protein